LTPVFCDVRPETHNVDPTHVERLLTPKTRAILGVHLWGKPCDIDALTKIADRHGLTLLFDAAHALGCSYRGRPIGSFGRAEVFSFHATKFVNTAEGGAITTNDDALASRLRAVRNFGFSPSDSIVDVGTNGKMSEISAAMGLTLFESLDDLIAANYQTFTQYKTELDGIPGVSLFPLETAEKSNYQYIVTVIDEAGTKISRDDLLDILRAENPAVTACYKAERIPAANSRSLRASLRRSLCSREVLRSAAVKFSVSARRFGLPSSTVLR
jgi:dTDP-4-amino-4,6-dideoxygalactose transaminase